MKQRREYFCHEHWKVQITHRPDRTKEKFKTLLKNRKIVTRRNEGKPNLRREKYELDFHPWSGSPRFTKEVNSERVELKDYWNAIRTGKNKSRRRREDRRSSVVKTFKGAHVNKNTGKDLQKLPSELQEIKLPRQLRITPRRRKYRWKFPKTVLGIFLCAVYRRTRIMPAEFLGKLRGTLLSTVTRRLL